jgi:predicted dehydrogenase
VTLRAGIVGLGVGWQHVAGYEAHPDCRVVAVSDVDPAVLDRAGAQWPHLRRTQDPFELLADPDIDVVSIASWDDAHFDQVTTALRAGKHVFVEKPLCQTPEQARAIRALLREQPHLRLSSNLPLRRSPRFLALRDWIAAGRLGRVFHVEGDYDYGRRHKLTDGWRGAIERYSVTLGGGVHLADLLLWLTGDTALEASGLGNAIATEGTAFRHDSLRVGLVRLASGATLKLSANLGCVSPHFHGLRVYGTEGTFHNGLPDGWLHERDGTTPVTAPYPGIHKGVLLEGFVAEILGGPPGPVSADDVFASMAVCFAIDAAAEQGAIVPVETF